MCIITWSQWYVSSSSMLTKVHVDRFCQHWWKSWKPCIGYAIYYKLSYGGCHGLAVLSTISLSLNLTEGWSLGFCHIWENPTFLVNDHWFRSSRLAHLKMCEITFIIQPVWYFSVIGFFIVNWASSWDYGTYHIGDQWRLRWACASAQSRQSLRCSHTWSMEVNKGSNQKSDI